MSSIVISINRWWNARATSQAEQQLANRVEALQMELSATKEQLEVERVKNRIQEVEIRQLAAVIGRDLERVKAETSSLGSHGGGRENRLTGEDA